MLTNTDIKTQMLNSLRNLITLKKEFFEACAKTLLAFQEKIKSQYNYIKAFINLYTELLDLKKKELKKLIADKVEPIDRIKKTIELQLIEFDLLCYKSLLENQKYKLQTTQIYDNVKQTIAKFISDYKLPANSAEELEKYYDTRALLSIEKYQYDIYYQMILLFNENNEEVLWDVLSSETTKFFSNFKDYVFRIINDSYILYKRYNDTYRPGERASFLTRLKLGNVPLQKQSLLAFASLTKDTDKEQRELYFKMINAQVICYDLISLYARLDTIQLAKIIGFLTVQKNVLEIEKSIGRDFDRYFRRIKDNIRAVNGIIPSSIFWSINNMDQLIDIKLAENTDKRGKNDYELLNINEELYYLQNQYTGALELLLPQLTNYGLLNTCINITDAELQDETNEEIVLTNSQMERLFFSEFLKNEDRNETELCKQQFMSVIREQIYDNSSPQISPFVS
jgi:hypothetical protein